MRSGAGGARTARPIEDGLTDDIDGIEPPTMLIPDGAVGILAGRSQRSFCGSAGRCRCVTEDSGRPIASFDRLALDHRVARGFCTIVDSSLD